MLAKTLQVASLVLIVWLVLRVEQTDQQLEQQLGMQTALLQQHKKTTEIIMAPPDTDPLLTNIQQQLEGLTQKQEQQSKAEKQLAAYKQQQGQLTDLRKAYILVLEAEVERGQKNAKGAVEKLKASKSLVWKSGSHYPKHKKTLQGLMGPLDVTIAAWAGGQLDKDGKAIYSTIQKVLSQQGQ